MPNNGRESPQRVVSDAGSLYFERQRFTTLSHEAQNRFRNCKTSIRRFDSDRCLGISASADGARRDKLQRWLESTLRPWFAGRILGIDETIADRWGDLSGALRARGIALPVIDGLLAATALHHNLTFTTRNAEHVAPTGVALYNPWEPER